MYEIKESDGSTTLTGERLKFYYTEHHLYAKEFALSLTQYQARLICRKLARHFKVRVWQGFYRGRGGLYRKSWSGGGEIFLTGKPDLGILCHEMSHAIHHQKYHKRGHTRLLARIMARVVRYCVKKGYWGLSEPAHL